MTGIEAKYIDITTNAIGNGVITGTKSKMTVTLGNIELPVAQEYIISLMDFRYSTVNLTDEITAQFAATSAALNIPVLAGDVQRYCESIVPLVQLNITEPISINGSLGNLIYKAVAGSSAAESLEYHVDQPKIERTFAQRINNKMLSTLEIQILRSDTGTLYPFDESPFSPPNGFIFEIIPIVDPFVNKNLIPLNRR